MFSCLAACTKFQCCFPQSQGIIFPFVSGGWAVGLLFSRCKLLIFFSSTGTLLGLHDFLGIFYFGSFSFFRRPRRCVRDAFFARRRPRERTIVVSFELFVFTPPCAPNNSLCVRLWTSLGLIVRLLIFCFSFYRPDVFTLTKHKNFVVPFSTEQDCITPTNSICLFFSYNLDIRYWMMQGCKTTHSLRCSYLASKRDFTRSKKIIKPLGFLFCYLSVGFLTPLIKWSITYCSRKVAHFFLLFKSAEIGCIKPFYDCL